MLRVKWIWVYGAVTAAPAKGCAVTSDVITLPDGRRLHWHEHGDKDGSPVIYTAGTPVSGLGGASYDETARTAGLRWISPDKPGYGGLRLSAKAQPDQLG